MSFCGGERRVFIFLPVQVSGGKGGCAAVMRCALFFCAVTGGVPTVLAVFCEEERVCGVLCFVVCVCVCCGGAGCLRCRGESVSGKFLIFGRRCAGPWPAIFFPPPF